MSFNHIPVLLHETIDSLCIRPDGIYVDCTTGGGSHSALLLSRLSPEGRLICIDRDPTAIAHITERFADYNNVTIIKDNFSNLSAILSALGISKVDGIMADLGISSIMVDTPSRGFSYNFDAPLDMRMSQAGTTAAEIINSSSEQELTKILFTYGEEKFAKSIARNIVARRQEKPIETTMELAELVKASIPARARREGGNPCKRTFQAFRIATNNEISDLPDAIDSMFAALKTEGVLSVITFHSLEDRIVKNKFKEYTAGCTCPPDFPICVCGKTPYGEIRHKAMTPGEKELEENNRSHSARLRSITRIKE